jgi:hypothetical protein
MNFTFLPSASVLIQSSSGIFVSALSEVSGVSIRRGLSGAKDRLFSYSKNNRYDLKVSLNVQLIALAFYNIVAQGVVRRLFCEGVKQLLCPGRIQMETILIVLLIVFLFGGGGWGYSRWRRN